MIILQFVLFNFTFILVGRGALIFFDYCTSNKFNFFKSKILNLPSSFYYSLIGLFVIGNLAFIFNFFSGTNNINLLVIIIVITCFNFFKIKFSKFTKSNFLYYIFTPSILSISTFNMGLHTDANLYHLSYQNWIRSEKIVFGLTNLHGRFGFSSIYDYISSLLWVGKNNFINLHYLNLIFLVIFFNFLIINVTIKNNTFLYYSSIFVTLFGLLDNFGFSGGRNGFLYIEGIGKQDVAFAVVFFITTLLYINAILLEDFNKKSLIMLSILTLFSIQIRVIGLSLLIFFVYYIYKLMKLNKLNILKYSFFQLLIGFFWIIKNLIISGCIFYPVEITCKLNLNWYINNQAKIESLVTSDFFYGLSTEENLIGWYRHWFASEFNTNLTSNFLLSIISLIFFRTIFFKTKITDKLTYYIIIFFIFFNFIFWIYNAPDFRFLMGLILIIVTTLAFGDLKFRSPKAKLLDNFLKTNYLYFLIILCIFFLPRTYKYKEFLSNPFNSIKVESLEIETVANELGWGLIPKLGDECGTNIDCIPYKKNVNLQYTKYLNYKIFK